MDDRNVEPGALFQKLQIALHVALFRRESNQEKSRRHLDGEPGLLALQHLDDGGLIPVLVIVTEPGAVTIPALSQSAGGSTCR